MVEALSPVVIPLPAIAMIQLSKKYVPLQNTHAPFFTDIRYRPAAPSTTATAKLAISAPL
jgi:hypothetical protein